MILSLTKDRLNSHAQLDQPFLCFLLSVNIFCEIAAGGGGSRFRIVSYNLLAEIYATQQVRIVTCISNIVAHRAAVDTHRCMLTSR